MFSSYSSLFEKILKKVLCSQVTFEFTIYFELHSYQATSVAEEINLLIWATSKETHLSLFVHFSDHGKST